MTRRVYEVTWTETVRHTVYVEATAEEAERLQWGELCDADLIDADPTGGAYRVSEDVSLIDAREVKGDYPLDMNDVISWEDLAPILEGDA
jgi:hypothetical protein